jgi:hypothetical protein
MSWLRIDDNAPQHRKLLKVIPAARWLWVCGLAYCQRLKTDGHIPFEALDLFAVPKPRPLADALVAAGLWHHDPLGYRVHDFLAWNDSAGERDDKTVDKTERQRRWREKKRLQRQGVDASTGDAVDTAPTPSPTPTPRENAHAVTVQTVPGPVPVPRRRGYGDPFGQRMDPSAAATAIVSDKQQISIQASWWERARKDRGLAFDAVDEFARWLAAEVRGGLAVGANKFAWLDGELARWVTARRAVSDSDAEARRTEAFLAEQAEHAAKRGTPQEIREGLRAGRALR